MRGSDVHKGCIGKQEQPWRAVPVFIVCMGIGWFIADIGGAFLGFVVAIFLQRGFRRIILYPVKREALEENISFFVQRGVNDDRLYMSLDERQINVYKEILQDGTPHFGVELPWASWRDFYSENIRQGLENTATTEIVEGNNGVYVQTDSISVTADILLYFARELGKELKDLRMVFLFRRRGTLGENGSNSHDIPGPAGIEK